MPDSRLFPRGARLTACVALGLWLVVGAVPRAQTSAAVVAVVLDNGKLLPLAARTGRGWVLLPWPRHDSEDAQPGPVVPASLSDIPEQWHVPLSVLPTIWRFQPIGKRPRSIHSGSPVKWEMATFDTIGLTTDYIDRRAYPDVWFDAGIAVAGDVEALPTRRLTATSAEWRDIVATFAESFVEAERHDARRQHRHRRIPSAPALRAQLLKAEVDLHEVSVAGGLTYYYYYDLRRYVHGETGTCLLEVYHRGLITRDRASLTKKWMAALDDGCDDPPQVMELVGGVRSHGRVRLIAKYSGDDWESYELLDPADRRAEFGGEFPMAKLDPRR
jgi:hypothetical protein